MEAMTLVVLMLVMAMLLMAALSGVANEAGTRMSKRNGKPGPVQLPATLEQQRARRERGLLIDVVG